MQSCNKSFGKSSTIISMNQQEALRLESVVLHRRWNHFLAETFVKQLEIY